MLARIAQRCLTSKLLAIFLVVFAPMCYGQTKKFNPFTNRYDYLADSASGEANTASNVTFSGAVGVFDAKSSVDLQFRPLKAASARLTITLDVGNRKVDIDIIESAFDLANLGGSLPFAKLPALTASRALATNSSGVIVASAVTATELQYVAGVTSALQTQLNAKAASSHAHAGTDITSGTIPNARIPFPASTSSPGGVTTTPCATGYAVQSYDTSGLPVCVAVTGGGGGGAGAGSYTQSFTAQTSVTLSHGLGSKNIIAACRDGSDNFIDWNTFVSTSTSAATVTFTTAQTGYCTVTIGGGGVRYGATFSSQTTVTISGTSHLLGASDIHVQCRDAASPRQIVEPNTITIDDTSFDVVITFAVAQSGRCSLI